jgi:hypothetical protein
MNTRQFHHPSIYAILLILATVLGHAAVARGDDPEPGAAAQFAKASANAAAAQEALLRSRRLMHAWLTHADPRTGLIPRNLNQPQWVLKDSAADNFPFLVLTAHLTEPDTYHKVMLPMLEAEQRWTNRLDRLGDDFDFPTGSFAFKEPDMERIAFGNAEYIKDGLLILTEAMGPDSPWAQRMIAIVDDLFKHAPIPTPAGPIPTTNVEVCGDLLQVLSRLFFITGDARYLDFAIRIGDYFLLGSNHPTRDFKQLRLRDHGCEIVSGLCELYFALSHARPEKKKQYEPAIHEMLDRILQVGLNEHGLMYDWVEPASGKNSGTVADNFGYNFNGFYTVFLVDGTTAYRDAALRGLASLDAHYRSFGWESADKDRPLGSADGYADAIEGALCLMPFAPIESTQAWINSQIRILWSMQQPDGIIEGWHGDGNFARTSIMYALWKTQGARLDPWRPGVQLGAVRHDGKLYVTITAKEPWTGRVIFDQPRHLTHMKFPRYYPRINHLPEWFTPAPDASFTVHGLSSPAVWTGQQMHTGMPVTLTAGQTMKLMIESGPPRQ